MTPRGSKTKQKLDSFSQVQKQFWNVADERKAKFERIFLSGEKTEEDWNRSAAAAAVDVLSGIEPEPDWTWLDVGCGVGRVIEVLAKEVPFRRMIGVDISEQMIGFARARFRSDPRLEWVVNNGYDLAGVGSGCVDFAFSVDVFIHIPDADVVGSYLDEIRRVLKPGGRFRFDVWRFDPDTSFSSSAGGRLARWLGRHGLWSPGSARWSREKGGGFSGIQYGLQDIRRFLRNAGLSEERISETPEGRAYWCTARKPGGS